MKIKPFTFGVATSGDNFTDRVEETNRLLLNFKYGINTILIKIQNNEGKIRTYTILVTRKDDRTSATLEFINPKIYSFLNLFKNIEHPATSKMNPVG